MLKEWLPANNHPFPCHSDSQTTPFVYALESLTQFPQVNFCLKNDYLVLFLVMYLNTDIKTLIKFYSFPEIPEFRPIFNPRQHTPQQEHVGLKDHPLTPTLSHI